MSAFDFEIPQDIAGVNPPDDSDLIARGPFVVVRQGAPSLGTGLRHNGEDIIYWDGGRTLWMDDTFDTQLNGDEIQVTNPEFGVDWVIRPITMDDVGWALPPDADKPTNLDDFKDTITELLSSD